MKKELKTFLVRSIAAWVVLTLAFVFIGAAVNSGKKFDVSHHDGVKQQFTSDGRVVYGQPGYYDVNISSHLAWQQKNAKQLRSFAFAVWLIIAVYITAVYLNWTPGNLGALVVLFVASIGLYIAAYSSVFVSNVVKVSEERYERIKDNPDSLKALFDKPLIR